MAVDMSIVMLCVIFGPILPIALLVWCTESARERRAAAEAEQRMADLAARWSPAPRVPPPAPPAYPPAPLLQTPAYPPVPVPPPPPPVMPNLGYFPYSAEGRRASEKLVCAVCLEEFEHGEKCSEVPACQHLFHKDCIDVWMESKTTCPLCRSLIVAGPEATRISAGDDMV